MTIFKDDGDRDAGGLDQPFHGRWPQGRDWISFDKPPDVKGKPIEVSRLWAAYPVAVPAAVKTRHSAGLFGHTSGGHGTPARGGRESYDDGVADKVLGLADTLISRVFQ